MSADLENCFAARRPPESRRRSRLAIETGLAGGSCEDFTGNDDDPIYDASLAAERVAAAVEAAHAGPVHFVLTARCENYLHGVTGLRRHRRPPRLVPGRGRGRALRAGRATTPPSIRRLVDAVDLPVNVLALPGTATVAELGEIGVKRISVGSGFSNVAAGALADAGRELLEQGTYDFWAIAGPGMAVSFEAFS